MVKSEKKPAKRSASKIDDLSLNTENGADQLMTTNQGLKINDNNNSLKAGERRPTLLEDFILREKTHSVLRDKAQTISGGRGHAKNRRDW